MELVTITAPTGAVATTAELKAQCRVKHSLEDTVLAACLLAATEWAEKFTGRALRAGGTFELWLDEFPSGGIRLPKPPVASVTSVKYYAQDGTDTTLVVTTDYTVFLPTGDEAGEAIVDPAYQRSWPVARAVRGSVRIRFVAGYDAAPTAIPGAVKQAVLMLADEMYFNRGESIVGTISAQAAVTAERLLWPFRVFHEGG